MDWQMVMERNLNEGTIRELHLYQIPLLKTCDNWPAVKEVGRIDFKGKHANYNGGMVRYATKFYFITNSSIEALAPYRKWNFSNKIKVVTELEHKKGKKK